jgi:hypothetical protein
VGSKQQMETFRSFPLKNLQSLSLHHFANVSNDDFIDGMSAVNLEALEILELHSLPNLHKCFLLRFMPRLRNLKELVLYDSGNLVNNEVLHAIFKDMKRLEKFLLTENQKVRSLGLLSGL